MDAGTPAAVDMLRGEPGTEACDKGPVSIWSGRPPAMSTERRPDREDRQLNDGAVNSKTSPPVERVGQTQARSGLTRDSTFLGGLFGAAATPSASEPRPSTPTVPDRTIVACESETWLLAPRTLSQLAW